MWQKVRVHNPYSARDASHFTHSASTPRKARQWAHVYQSAREAGLPESRSIMAASSAVKSTNPLEIKWTSHKKKNSLLTDIVAGDLLTKGYTKAKKVLGGRKKNKYARTRRTAASFGVTRYVKGKIGGRTVFYAVKTKAKKNPYLAILGNPRKKKSNKGGLSMAARRRNRRMPRRNSKGRFIKASAVRHNRHRRRRNAAPKIRYRTRTRNVIRYRTKKRNTHRRRRNQGIIPIMVESDILSGPYRKVKGALLGRRSKKSSRRRRRNTLMAATRRRRRVGNRHHHRRHHRRRRNLSTGSFIPTTPQIKQILWAAGGVFVGGKLTGLVWNKIGPTLNLTGTADTVARLVVGGALTALTWQFNPMFGLGVGLGAFSTVTDYLFSTLWGIQSQYTGISGMGTMQDYINRGYKVDNWVSLPSPAAAVSGLGANPLLKRTM